MTGWRFTPSPSAFCCSKRLQSHPQPTPKRVHAAGAVFPRRSISSALKRPGLPSISPLPGRQDWCCNSEFQHRRVNSRSPPRPYARWLRGVFRFPCFPRLGLATIPSLPSSLPSRRSLALAQHRTCWLCPATVRSFPAPDHWCLASVVGVQTCHSGPPPGTLEIGGTTQRPTPYLRFSLLLARQRAPF